MVQRLGLCLALSLVAGGVSAQSAQVALSEKSAHFRYGMLVGGQSFGRSEVALGFMYNSDENYLGDFGLFVVDEAGSKVPGLEAGVGGKLVAARNAAKHKNFLAGALGLTARYAIPGLTRLAIGGEGYYAPGIVSGVDAKNYIEYAGRVEYEVLPQAAAYVGYRYMGGTDRQDARVDFNKTVHLGLRVTF